MVGTVDYIAPEVFTHDGYTETVDWWSLGTLMFEMLIGYPPFCGNDMYQTYLTIANFRKHFEIPDDANISAEAEDLMRKLINEEENRLGRNGASEIKKHPFFKGIDWKTIRSQKAPMIPILKSEIDTRNFEKFEEKEGWHEESNKDNYKKFKRR